jgi:N-acetylglucosamine-6-phosphate deacetylase
MEKGKAAGSGRVRGRHYETGEAVEITMAEGRIVRVEAAEPVGREEWEAWPWIGPGLVDLQINGYAGIDLNTPPLRTEDVHAIARKLWQEGVTAFCPTVVTNGDEQIERTVEAVARACAEDPLTRDCIAGIHLEGPFISPQDGPRGAHRREYVKAPDWELFQRWQRAAGGRIKIVTLSPEYEEAPSFIEKCARSGVVASIGHTAATTEQIRRAVLAGAAMSTHLGNGAHPVIPRHPNYIWDQLAEEKLAPCAIADGHHLPASVLKVFLRAKSEQLMLVSDAVALCGMAPGEYEAHIGGRVVLTEDGRLHLADDPNLLAGSVKTLRADMEYLVAAGICALRTGWEMASVRPAKFMGLPAGAGLSAGAPADLVRLTWDRHRLKVVDVYKNGCRVAHA